MCETCREIGKFAEEARTITKLLDRGNCTDADYEAAAECIKEATPEMLKEYGIQHIAHFALVRIARCVSMITNEPMSIVLGQAAGLCFEAEAADSFLDALAAMAEEEAKLN